jgi:hypothetical protein
MKKLIQILCFCLCWLWFPSFAFALDDVPQQAPDGGVILSPESLSELDRNLTLLEENSKQQELLLSGLRLELGTANDLLTTLEGQLETQIGLVGNLKLQWNLISERLQTSDQSWAWIQEDLMAIERKSAAMEQENSRLKKTNRALWWAVSIVGALAVGGVAAAIVF